MFEGRSCSAPVHLHAPSLCRRADWMYSVCVAAVCESELYRHVFCDFWGEFTSCQTFLSTHKKLINPIWLLMLPPKRRLFGSKTLYPPVLRPNSATRWSSGWPRPTRLSFTYGFCCRCTTPRFSVAASCWRHCSGLLLHS